MFDPDAFPVTRKWPARHPERLQLYSLPTPNGVKVSIMLEETGLPYGAHRVDFAQQEQLSEPFFATNFTIAHMGLPQTLEGNIHEYYYPVGHMLYLNPAVLPQLQHNIEAFITNALQH